MLASQDNLPGRTLIGIKVWSKGIFKSLKTALMFATAKNNHSLNKGDDAFAIISFYTSLYKKGEVSWRWLLERLAFVGDDRIQYDNGVLPAVLEREFLEVQKILSEGGDLSTLKCEEARKELVQFKYITQSKYVLFMRANELLEKLNLEEAFFAVIPKGDSWKESYGARLFNLSAVASPAREGVAEALKPLLDSLAFKVILSPIQSELKKLLEVETFRLSFDELRVLVDKLEDIHRKLALGVRVKSRKIAISSDLYVLSQLPKITGIDIDRLNGWSPTDKPKDNYIGGL